MRLLADTQALVWYCEGNPKLSPVAMYTLADPANEILVSPASYWEIAIKVALGKWQLLKPYEDLIDEWWTVHGFRQLHILPAHTSRLLTLATPTNHKDPFDRLIVAQALVECLPLVSSDPKLDQYGITRLW